jgi:thymidylate kinase
MSVWALEEWLRQAVAGCYTATGHIVVFDRHFFADYYHSDVDTGGRRRGGAARVHGWMLQHLYPKPGLVICLDAPAELLYSRKPEATPDWLDQRRRQYLDLAAVVPAFVVVDATRPVEAVLAEVVAVITDHWKALTA